MALSEQLSCHRGEIKPEDFGGDFGGYLLNLGISRNI